ncbi:MAG: sulfite exporter TauE/SafE family protein [Alteromonadaceae bacterium]|nr:sulfite exporter TauE/SafE family protein [Alteromonadaceae bacterium]
MLLTVFIACLILGSVVGFLAGLLGIGGGLIIVPVLVYLLPLFEVSPDEVMSIALATSLASIVITSASAAYAHHKNQNILWGLTRQLLLTISVGALLGAIIADFLSAEALTNFFGFAVMLLATYMLFSICVKKAELPSENSGTAALPSNVVLKIIGLFTGVVASLMGIAGGAILVPTLSYCAVPLRQTIGTATVCGMMVAFFGSAGYIFTGFGNVLLPEWSLGYIYLPALIGIITTSSIFAPIGVKFATRLPVSTLKTFFAGFLILVAIKMLWF